MKMNEIKLNKNELNAGELIECNSKSWLFTYKQESFLIKKDDTKPVFNFMIYNNNLPNLNTGSLKSCLFMIKRILKNKECLTIMSLANNHNLIDGFSYEFTPEFKNSKSYKNFINSKNK